MAPTNGTTKGSDAAISRYSISDVIEIWTELVVFQALDNAEARSAQVLINNYVTNNGKTYDGVGDDLFPFFRHQHGWFEDVYLKKSEIGKAKKT